MKTTELAKLLEIPKLLAYLEKVEQVMEKALATADPNVKQPALRVIRGGGKRLRPSLVIATALSQGAAIDDKVIRAAAAVELLHIASLVHDDIIDQADTRRGVATVNQKEGVDSAILVGDYLVAVALAQAASVSQEVAAVLATAFGKMCEGQAQELADNFNPKRDIDNYLLTIKNKTAILMGAACEIGGLSAGLGDKEVTALREYGEAFGMAFQLADDVLDFLSTAEASGKPVANDLKEGVYTLPLLLALQSPDNRRFTAWLGKKPQSAKVTEALLAGGYFQQTLDLARDYNQQASITMTGGLAGLPEAYLKSVLARAAEAHQLVL